MVRYLATATIAASLMAVLPTASLAAPEWGANYGKALTATRADDQPLLVVLEKPSSAENGVQQVVHTVDTVSTEEAQMLAPYQLCKVDVSTAYGKKVARAFGATSFPYTAVIDRTGSIILYSKSGSHNASEWSNMLTTYKSGNRINAVLASASASAKSVVAFRKPYDSVDSKPVCKSCQRGK